MYAIYWPLGAHENKTASDERRANIEVGTSGDARCTIDHRLTPLLSSLSRTPESRTLASIAFSKLSEHRTLENPLSSTSPADRHADSDSNA